MIIIGISSCTKKLSIADFSDDFRYYTSELRIEAILTPTDIMNSVVRIDKTMLVTDTSLFNGLDDNGDWVSFTDENNNGQWDNNEPLNDDIGGFDGGKGNGKPDKGEPHVDDYTEILPLIHDSTMISVLLIDKISGQLVAEFEWHSNAGKIEEFQRGDRIGSEIAKVFHYGGYKPMDQYASTQIEFGKEYEFRITTADNNVITGTTKPFPPAKLVLENTVWNADTLIINSGESDIVHFLTDDDVSFGSFTFREVINRDSLILSHSIFFPPSESDQPGYSVFNLSKGMFPIGLSQVTISIFDNSYSQYFISDLSLRDEMLSNLRDQNNTVILGIAGSSTVTTIYVNNIL
ncbi:MAG: hypothetical protein GWP19_02335 [Planctomycetia bacterium]|nr:hypothetical protein [Planctomycetia bacterium]